MREGREYCTNCGRDTTGDQIYEKCGCREAERMSEEPKTPMPPICDIKFGVMCPAMSSVQMIPNLDWKAGVVSVMGFDKEGRNTKRVGFVLRGPSNSSGIMMNYCPFCGEAIRPGNDT